MKCACIEGETLCAYHQNIVDQARSEAVITERKACAAVARSRGQRECDDRGAQDPETGEVPCRRESRGGSCLCADLDDMAHEISKHILARGT